MIQTSIHRTNGFFPTSGFLAAVNATAAAIFCLLSCQSQTSNYENWAVYKADVWSSSYSTLDLINRENVDMLETAWIFYPNDAPEDARPMNSESNPLIIDGILYTTSARSLLYAVDASSGTLI